MLTRYALISMMDMFMCIFISLNSAQNGEFISPDYLSNLLVSYILIGLFACFVVIVVGYGIWRMRKIDESDNPFYVPVNAYIDNLYEGVCTTHPGRNLILHLMFMARQVSYAAIIIYLYEDPVFQLISLLVITLVYNVTVSFTHPFYEFYNMALHYINEVAFFFFILMCLTFTDFVADVQTRSKTASGLTNFMFAILVLNIVICVASIVMNKKQYCFPSKWLKSSTEEKESEKQPDAK